MPDLPRRPGFTTGIEEELWHGAPALRCTIYVWTLSIAFALFFHNGWQGFVRDGSLYSMVSYAPFLLNYFYPRGQPALWLTYLSWPFILFPVFWYTLGLAMTSYSLTTQRLTVKSGILVRIYDQLELFRVRDFVVDAPVHNTILGLGHVRILSRDESLPMLTLYAQPEPEKLVNLIRDRVQARRDEVGMREFETNSP